MSVFDEIFYKLNKFKAKRGVDPKLILIPVYKYQELGQGFAPEEGMRLFRIDGIVVEPCITSSDIQLIPWEGLCECGTETDRHSTWCNSSEIPNS